MTRIDRPRAGKGSIPASRARAPARGASRQNWFSENAKVAIPAALLLMAVLVWALWPSSYSRVVNLDSRGSSIIAFGDSLTAGYGASKGEDYPARLSSILGVPVVNVGVSGDTTEAALARIEENVLSRNPRIVLIGLGGNDYLRGVPIASTEENLRTIVRRIQQAGAMAVVLGFRFPSLNVNYEKMYERVAGDGRALLIPDLLDGIMGKPSLKSDAIHPNAAGYQLLAERISGPARKLIAKADAAR